MSHGLKAGAASADTTPKNSQFLYGYPHVKRYSTGVHDPLLASALYLSDGQTSLVFVACDVIFITKALAERARRRIAERTGIPRDNIMVTATHTHSGPITVYYLSNEADPVVPQPDPGYLRLLEDGIVTAGEQACAAARTAEAGLVVADGTSVGTNRHDPAGPRDPEVPVLLVRGTDGAWIGAMFVCCMHPTVLHEDSTLVSGDFPAITRQYLQSHALASCPILCHTGPAGDQSPRRVVRANTLDEMRRLGTLLGESIAREIPRATFSSDLRLACRATTVDLPVRRMPAVDEAVTRLASVQQRLESLRQAGASREEVRTAECDWFGAEESVTLARAAASDKLTEYARTCLPAEVQVMQVGPWRFVGWPGEWFVEYGLQVKARQPSTYVMTLANGELQGYIVTPQAVAEGWYEGSNALFDGPASGERVVNATMKLLV